MVENDDIISDESKVTNSFSIFFENAIHSLGIKTNKYSNDNCGLKSPAEIYVKKYEQHWSINLIKENITNNKSFHFLPTEKQSILKEIINKIWNFKKHYYSPPQGCIRYIYSPILANIWNEEILLKNIFPKNLKLAGVSPVLKKKD